MPRNKSNDSENTKHTCCVCSQPFDSLSEFNKSYSSLYAGTGRLPLCKECLTKIFKSYASEYGDTKKAMKRMCMAYDLYYNDSIFDKCNDGSDTIMGNYIKKLNMAQYKGRTFDNSLKEGFSFDSVTPIKQMPQTKHKVVEINEKDISNWGDGFSPEDYEILNSHYKYLTDANPQCDSNQEIFIMDLCYTKMQQMKAVREGKVDDYNKLTESYRKSFTQAGLKTVKETNNEEFTVGVTAETIEKYTPAEYYRNKGLYKDFDNLSDYFSRLILRPLRNLIHGTKERDFEFYVKEGDEDDYSEE